MVNICSNEKRPGSHIEYQAYNAPKYLRLHKLPTSHSGFPTGFQCAVPREVKSKTDSKVNQGDGQEKQQKPRSNFANVQFVSHDFCAPFAVLIWQG
jgi:hypothetical protein